MKYVLLLLTAFTLNVHASIGTMSEVQGTAIEIKRNKDTLQGKPNSSIESMDSVIVGSKATVGITFKDNTRVKITENSRLVIDDFVFDAKKSDAGKLGMKVALGTVRYASGQVAKNNPQNVNIKTPTATIAVRGTDFAMTVDEVGRSLVVLLPSCDDPTKVNNYQIQGNCIVGAIDVVTDAGIVSLNQAYTATYVTDAQQPPLPPVKVDPVAVSNDSNLKKPETIARVENDREQKKDSERDKSKFGDDERKKSSESNEKSLTEKKAQEEEGTKLIGLNSSNNGVLGTPASNPCWPFNDCGNEKGLNWYYRKDDDRGNTIFIRSGEKYDNTTYNISINSNDIETRVNGDGSNKVTVRIWNK
jgi:FecR protein